MLVVHKISIKILIIFITFVLCYFVAHAKDRELNIVSADEDTNFNRAARMILKTAYLKLGITAKFKRLPAGRALVLSNYGKADGELMRISGINLKYVNLIKVPVAYIVAEQTAFGTHTRYKINGWSSLKPYRLAFHRGYLVAEKNTKSMHRDIVTTDVQAFQMLEIGRVDIAIANRFTGQRIIQENNFKNIKMLTPPIQVDPLFHYLNKKHRHIVPRIAKVLQRMKNNGEIEKILISFKVPPLSFP